MDRNPKVVALIAASAFFMQTLDSTIVATALPRMAISFGVPPIQMSPVITAYVAALVVFMPVSGWLADRFGARTVFQAAIGLFAVGSIFCALSTTLLELTAARVFQGAAGAMLAPIARLVVLRSAPRAQLVGAMAMLSIPQQLGPVLGPPIGGFITTYASWPWIFFLNVPVGIAAIAIAPRYIANDPGTEPRPLDWPGFFLVGGTLSCLITALSLISRGLAGISEVLVLAACGIGLGIAGLYHLRRCKHPLIDLSLFQIPSFRVNVTGGAAFRIGVGATPFLLPLLLQVALSMSAFQSGLLIFGNALGQVLMKPSMPYLLRRFGFRWLLIMAAVACPLSLAVCCLFDYSTPLSLIFVVLLAGGFCQSVQFSSLNALTFSDLAPQQMSAATGLAQLSQQFAFGVGVAIASVLLHVVLAMRNATEPAPGDFRIVFAIVACISFSSIYFYLRLSPEAGGDLSGYRSRSPASQALHGTKGD